MLSVMPESDPLERPFQNRPTPEVLDSLIYEIVDSEKADFVQIPEGQYHPEVRDFPAHRLIKEERVAWNRVRRWWSDGFTNQDTYNYDIGYDHESATFPMYVRRYLIRRDEQTASTRNAAFTGVWQIRVTAGGSGYPPDTTATIAAPGAGATATAQAIVKDGVVVWVKIVTEGSGYTSAPVVTIAGTGGVGATATAVIQATAVLVSEKYQDLPEDDNRRSLYISCVRVWKQLPGPVMESKTWGVGGLQKQTQTTDVAPSVTLVGGDNLVGEQMKEVTKAESQYIIEKLLTAAGGAISGDAEWTEETREGTSGVTFYRTFRMVDTDYTFPREGTVFKTGFFLDGQINDFEGSPQFLAQFNWVKSDLGQVVFNTEREFVAESITHPVFAISRLVPIEDYSPSTVDAAFGEVLIADLTNGGSGYTSAPTLGTSGGAGSGFAGVAQVEGGVIVSIRITNGGTGFTGNTTITFTGGGGSGAAASGIIIPVTAVLVSQRARPAEGNLRPLFYRVLRIYKTLPGPTLTSVEWAQGGLIKRREVTDVLPSTTLTTVGAGTVPMLSEQIKAVTTAESQKIVETLRAADGTVIGAAPEYTLAVRDGEWQVNIYTTFRVVPASFALPQEGDTFAITYPRSLSGWVIEGKLTAIEGSPNCLAMIEWTDAPEHRVDYPDYQYTFPGVLELASSDWLNTEGVGATIAHPWMGIDARFRTPQTLSITARRTLFFTQDPTSFLPVPYRVVSPGSGSKAYPFITQKCIHPRLQLFLNVVDGAGNTASVPVEDLPASRPDSYDPRAILIASSTARKWRGRTFVREVIEVSEQTHPQQFPTLYTLTPFIASTQTDLLVKRLDEIGFPNGTPLVAFSSNAGDTTQTLRIVGKRENNAGEQHVKLETLALSGTTQVLTARQDWIKVIQVTLSATTTGAIDLRTPGTANSGAATIVTGITSGTTLTIVRGVDTKVFTFTNPETTTIVCGDYNSIGIKAAQTLTIAVVPTAGEIITIGSKVYTWKASVTDVAATDILTLNSNPLNLESVTVGGRTYQFQTTLTNVAGNVLRGSGGAAASDSIDNLIAAITLGAGSGTAYAAATTVNPLVTAAVGVGDTMGVTALVAGAGGNNIAATETFTDALSVWTTATLAGGVTNNADGNVLIAGTAALSRDNMTATVNVAGGSGYATATTANTQVTAISSGTNGITTTAISGGTGGNLIASTTTMVGAGNVWGGATLVGGATGFFYLYVGNADGTTQTKVIYWFDKSGTDTAPLITASELSVRINLNGVLASGATAAEVATQLEEIINDDGFFFDSEVSSSTVTVAAQFMQLLTDGAIGVAGVNTLQSPWAISVATQGVASAVNQLRIWLTPAATAEALLQAMDNMTTAIANGTASTATVALTYEASIVVSRLDERVAIDDAVTAATGIVWTLTPSNAFITTENPDGSGVGRLIVQFPAATTTSVQRNAFQDINFWNPDLEDENLPAGLVGESDAIDTNQHSGFISVRVAGRPGISIGFQTSANGSTWSGTTTIGKCGDSLEYREAFPLANFIRLTFNNSVGTKARAIHAVALINLIA